MGRGRPARAAGLRLDRRPAPVRGRGRCAAAADPRTPRAQRARERRRCLGSGRVLRGQRPIEEAFFRGLVQGGLSALTFPVAGFVVATAAYVLYHRLGWSWPDTLATALLGVPVGLAFWLLPGPPSLLGVTIAHVAATCGFLGPGPYLLARLGLL